MKIYVDKLPKDCLDCPLMACKEFGEDESHCPLHKIEDVQNRKVIKHLEELKLLIRDVQKTIAELKGEKDE